MKLKTGKYVTDNSDLIVQVHVIHYQNDRYAKVRLSLTNKRNGIDYDLNKSYKVIKENIKHWRLM